MPHRGLLNVLDKFMGKPFAAIFSEFQGNAANPEHVQGSGDVKYHLGTSGDREIGGRTVHLSLAANPSHLEAVDPVVLGKVRAKQHQRGDAERNQVVGILMHGDAAFAGQGLVAESLELADLRGFRTGGTIHIIVNNQIGFTTSPSFARSSPYPSDLETQFAAAESYRPNKADWFEGAWAGLETAPDDDRRGDTAAPAELLCEVGRGLVMVPEGFHLNRKIARQLEAKRAALASGEGIDWATADALAIGTLCAEGTHVRLSGQDSGRGTFSHRHAVLVDQETEERYVPINHIREGQAPFELIDSPLSEAAVVGFEYGYSPGDPMTLVLWDAQFGDFANGAQVIIDQFLSSGEAKWLRMSGLVLLLPHGYEGQGPEHSSARLERYLQLCAEDNMQVCNLTTAANYFHALRRQIRRKFRKPLVIVTPKSLLRAKEVMSSLADMGPGTTFHRVIGED